MSSEEEAQNQDTIVDPDNGNDSAPTDPFSSLGEEAQNQDTPDDPDNRNDSAPLIPQRVLNNLVR